MLNIICKQWIELRELPESERAEMSYIRLEDIERVSFVESSRTEFRIFVDALGEMYLYAVVETIQEAQAAAEGLIEAIENSQVHA